MIMRITQGKLHPGAWSAYEQAYKAIIVAQSSHIEGLRGRWLGQDLHDLETGYAGSLWDSVEAIRAYEHSDFYTQEILPVLQPFFVGDFTTTYCEVKVTRNARKPGRQSV